MSHIVNTNKMVSDTPRTDAACNIYDLQIVAEDIERELNTANERIKRLEEAGDALAKTQTYDLVETVNWRKAKEAKP